jgi:hypothetical protein
MPAEQAVIVDFKYGLADLDALSDLEEKLEQAISAADVGEYDGNDVAADLTDGTLYMYGPDADALHTVIMPHLSAAAFMKGAICRRRYGAPNDLDAKEVQSLI